ncbi:MAG: signal peptide peptidase SppA [Alphaproteobacteria bacterium]|nr:signal peptide peptidase SppA [Alphaproteobacteria bacterium]
MKFVTRLFALIGFLVVAVIVGSAILAAHMQKRAEAEPNKVILTLDFDRPIAEQNDTSPFDLALEQEPVVLFDILHAIDKAAEDPYVKGLVARFGTEQPSLIQAQEIRAALARFRKSGKFTYAYGTDFGEFGLGSRAYFLASAFENIWLQPVGTVSLTGVSLQSPFAKTALDKIGVVADFMQRKEYKSFMEMGERDSFSPPVKAEMQTMVDNLSDQIAGGIATSRKWDIGHVKDLMSRGPYTDEEALQEGLVTRLAYADEFDDEIDRKAGKDAKQVGVETYLGFTGGAEDTKNEKTVALIYGTGLILDKNPGGGDMISGHVMSAKEIAGAFDDAADDKDVKAILFRIDSPGGSPAASETIRRAMIHAEKKGKPVIVSMGDAAASGGYWCAMNGDKIIADPATLTGSIGVVAGKFASDGLLQKLGLSVDGVSTAENAGMWTVAAPFTPMQRARVNALLDNTYNSFVSDVAAARKIPMAKMPDIAEGRVWTGEQAVKIGLVDELGGYAVALAAVRKALKLDEKTIISIETFPLQPTPAERVLKLMRRFGAESAMLSSSLKALAGMQTALQPFLANVIGADSPVSARMLVGVRE